VVTGEGGTRDSGRVGPAPAEGFVDGYFV
jgi:hypothetical protein